MKKVLIVEDQRMPRENMERILLDSGKYALSASVNGADVALAVCRREQIDLILMDVMMPQLDGYEATRAIRALDRPDAAAIPIFAMTANAFTEDRRRAYDSGMNEHLTKPLEPDTLLRTLAKYLQR